MIALDANGADRGPATVAEGGRLSGTDVTLFGPVGELAGYSPVVDAPVSIANDEEPVRAVRNKPESSIVQAVRSERPDLLIVSRARDAVHARHLYAVGVTDAVPETIEASLQLSEAALVGLGLPAGPVIASIHEKRDEFRRELQEAAGRAGLAQTRSIRAKTLRGA